MLHRSELDVDPVSFVGSTLASVYEAARRRTWGVRVENMWQRDNARVLRDEAFEARRASAVTLADSLLSSLERRFRG